MTPPTREARGGDRGAPDRPTRHRGRRQPGGIAHRGCARRPVRPRHGDRARCAAARRASSYGRPPGRHGHVLLPSGLRELTALLPGFTDDLRAHGAHLLHVGEIRFHVAGDHLRLDDTEPQLVGATRPAARVGGAVPGQRPAQRRDHRRRRRPRPRARRRCARDRAERPSAGRRVRDDARRRPGRRRRRSRITVARWLADAGIAPPVAGSHTGSAPSTRTCRSSLSRAVATSSSRWLPDGYAVLGDAVCSLNSLYAQGMSMALREAALLGRIVDRHGTRGVGVAFLREATRWSTPPGRWRPARTSATRRSPGRGRSPGGCSISTSANLQRRTRGGGAGVSHDTNPRRCSRGTGYWR